ncbi:hemagglutinin [Mycoplasmopsis synoviae]|uniref:hemagglutinin n=1 Tax=Mycoplasmopsis synoviae TaxID=2109 RepID=UPI001CE0D84D|nr:hemagglutinin [Mycoplasmopsis synoviae]
MLALYWDGFMPKIVLTDFHKTWEQNSEENERKIREWFDNAVNWAGLSDQLTKKLGAERFKNVKLTYKEVTFSTNAIKTPTVTFTVAAKDGYTLVDSGENASATEISLVVRVLYNRDNENTIQMPTQGASSSAVPNRASSPNDETTIKTVNVYLNYTGPSIVLDAELPQVGSQDNTSINGTSNVTGAFNTAFRGNPSRGLLFTNRYPNPLLKSVINYVNKFDPKYRAEFVTNSKNGVTITKVQSNTQLRPGTLDDLVKNRDNVFLQQVHDDSSAVYFAVNGVGDNKWLSTFLIRIPLTKFVKPLTEFRPVVPSTPASPENSEEETQQDSQENNEAEQGTTGQTENNSTEEATEDSGSGSSNTDSSQNSDQQSQQSPQSQQQ